MIPTRQLVYLHLFICNLLPAMSGEPEELELRDRLSRQYPASTIYSGHRVITIFPSRHNPRGDQFSFFRRGQPECSGHKWIIVLMAKNKDALRAELRA